MSAPSESVRDRRYLLGEASDEECTVIEQEYLQHEEAVDRIAAAEDDLIEDYLGNQLTPADRSRFERSYLSMPEHRVRVETIRRLMEHGAQSAQSGSSRAAAPAARYGTWLALAASVVIAALGALWLFTSRGARPVDVAENPQQPPAATASPDATTRPGSIAPRVFALAISPVAVRGAGDSPTVVIPADTDVVSIRLERDADTRALTPRRASIQIVGGAQVWQGDLAVDRDASPAAAARLDVPAASLLPNDYIVTLYGGDAAGVEREWAQYFLRVRAR